MNVTDEAVQSDEANIEDESTNDDLVNPIETVVDIDGKKLNENPIEDEHRKLPVVPATETPEPSHHHPTTTVVFPEEPEHPEVHETTVPPESPPKVPN